MGPVRIILASQSPRRRELLDLIHGFEHFLPIDPALAAACDAGKVEDYDVAGALDPIIAQIEAAKQD